MHPCIHASIGSENAFLAQSAGNTGEQRTQSRALLWVRTPAFSNQLPGNVIPEPFAACFKLQVGRRQVPPGAQKIAFHLITLQHARKLAEAGCIDVIDL